MPVHICDWDSLVETIKAVEKKGEEYVDHIDAPSGVIVVTRKPKQQYETRKRAT